MYVGCTSNLDRRLELHNFGLVKSTKNRRPFSLIYTEIFSDKTEAFNKERFLKSLWGARLKKKVLDDFLSKRSRTNCD